MTGRKFRFERDPLTGRCRIWFEYDKRLVEIIKRTVPSSHRDYDPNTKVWTISWWYEDDVKQRFIAVELDDEFQARGEQGRRTRDQGRQQTSSSANTPVTLEDIFASLFSVLPSDLAPRAHRALVRTLHPDAGGDHEIAVALNRAWDKAVAA